MSLHLKDMISSFAIDDLSGKSIKGFCKHCGHPLDFKQISLTLLFSEHCGRCEKCKRRIKFSYLMREYNDDENGNFYRRIYPKRGR